MTVQLAPGGAAIQSLVVPDRAGNLADVVLGFDDPAAYNVREERKRKRDASMRPGRARARPPPSLLPVPHHSHASLHPFLFQDYNVNTQKFGVVVGRVINRIKGAAFDLDGKTVNLTPNDANGNALHGGAGKGWGDQVWTLAESSPLSAKYTYHSPSGDQGFPGAVDASVTYTLESTTNTLTAVMEATSDAPTPLNLAQHSYFNLNGQGNGTVLSTVAQIEGAYFTELDSKTLLPTGAIKPVSDAPAFDFQTPAAIGSRFSSIPNPEPGATGYDLLYVLFGKDGAAAKADTVDCAQGPDPKFAARFSAPESGRTLELWTNAPGLEFYTGNHLDGSVAGKAGVRYPQYAGFALEAQDFSDFMHHPNFPQCVLRPGAGFRRVWQLKFGTDKA